MWRQVMPGVFASQLDSGLQYAAQQWLLLCAGLGLAPEASARGVLTEFEMLRDFAMLSPSGAEYVLRDDVRQLRQNGGRS